MRCRGFDGAFPPTAVLKWKFRDSLLLAACTAFLVLVIIDEYGFEYGTWKNWF
jgi:energy-coupling factor transporter transmembrane protein EcfT